MGKLVGIDFGTNKIGIAISDSKKKIAFPRGILKRKNKSYCIEELKDFLKNEEIDGFVIGIPFNRAGIRSDFLTEIERYSSTLKKLFKKPVHFVDESYTTRIVLRSMINSGIKMKKRQKYGKNIDDISAQLILQSYLDKIDT